VVVEREGRGGAAQAEESTEEGGGYVGQHDDHATGLVLVERVCAVVLLCETALEELKTLLDDWAPFSIFHFLKGVKP